MVSGDTNCGPTPAITPSGLDALLVRWWRTLVPVRSDRGPHGPNCHTSHLYVVRDNGVRLPMATDRSVGIYSSVCRTPIRSLGDAAAGLPIGIVVPTICWRGATQSKKRSQKTPIVKKGVDWSGGNLIQCRFMFGSASTHRILKVLIGHL